MSGIKKSLSIIAPPFIILVALLTSWAGAVELFNWPPFLVPGPALVVKAAIANIDRLERGLINTFTAAATGIAFAILIGVLVAIIMSLSRFLEIGFYPWAVVLQTTPVVAIAPLIVLWVGAGLSSVKLITFIIALFPILANTLMGLRSTDLALVDLLRMQGASMWTILYKIRIPSSLPFFLTGLRISAGLGVIGAIVGEMVVGRGGDESGLGYYVIFSSTQLKTDFLFATIILSTSLGVTFFALAYILGWLTLRKWHESAIAVEE